MATSEVPSEGTEDGGEGLTGDNSDADPDLYKDNPQHALLHLYHNLITQPTLIPCHT